MNSSYEACMGTLCIPIFFCFTEDADAADIDCEKYHMEKLNLTSIVADPKASVVIYAVSFIVGFCHMIMYY